MFVSKPDYYTSIEKTLEAVKDVEKDYAVGDFATGGEFSLPLPGISISGTPCACLSLPLCECQAKLIITESDDPEEGSASNTWQLSPTKFSIINSDWNRDLENCKVNIVRRRLGCDSKLTPICCKLHKLLLVGPGGFYKVM